MPRQTFRLEIPAAGLNRRFGFQDQPPFSTPSVQNFRPYDTILGRERGGSRPGIAKLFSTALGAPAAAPVRLLTDVAYVASNTVNLRMVASAAGDIYYEEPAGTWAAGPTDQLSSTQQIMAVDRNQQMYLADWDPDYAVASAARKPKIWDPIAHTVSDWATAVTAGTLPLGCSIAVLHLDRIFLGGDVRFPHTIYASRQSDPLDWDFSATDQGGAFATNTGKPGQIGEPVTALVPHGNNCMVIFCVGSTWLMRGDPKVVGQVINLDSKVGCIDRFAWCHAPANADGSGPRLTAFLSHDGLYVVPAGCEMDNAPQKFSRLRLPEELIGVDPSVYQVSMQFDIRAQGIYLFITHKTAGTSTHWFIDWVTRGIFPITIPSNFEPFAVHHRRKFNTQDSTVALGCRDGYVRYYDHDQLTDDGTAFDSHVDFGPLWAGEQGFDEGVLCSIGGTLAKDSGDVILEVRSGSTPEEAYNALPRYRVLWSHDQLNATHYPRIRGGAFFVRLRNAESGRRWALDGALRVEMERQGRLQL